MSIGDFSRATRLSAKTLRFYHRAGLLSPARVDSSNGYRFYGVKQIAEAQVIRDFRALEMPVSVIREVLSDPSVSGRNRLIADHLERMEAQLEATRSAVVSLRSLLQQTEGTFSVEYRSLLPVLVVMIRETIDLSDLGAWYTSTVSELDALLISAGVVPTGARGGVWDTDLFLEERGEAAMFFPIESAELTVMGRARVELLPAVDLAVALHVGTDDTIAEVYGELGRYVALRGLSIDGPIRETYVTEAVNAQGVATTEIGWPITPSANRSAE